MPEAFAFDGLVQLAGGRRMLENRTLVLSGSGPPHATAHTSPHHAHMLGAHLRSASSTASTLAAPASITSSHLTCSSCGVAC